MKKRLQEWAREEGISRATAYRLFRENKLPYPVERIGERIILLTIPDPEPQGKLVIYARVSTRGQGEDLRRQKLRLLEHCVAQGWTVDQVIEEIASGLNDHRRGLLKILKDSSVTTIVVEHRERLTRMGFTMLQATLEAQGRRIVVLDEGELEDDLVRDVTEVLTSFCARLYGRRGARGRAQRALAQAEEDTLETP